MNKIKTCLSVYGLVDSILLVLVLILELPIKIIYLLFTFLLGAICGGVCEMYENAKTLETPSLEYCGFKSRLISKQIKWRRINR